MWLILARMWRFIPQRQLRHMLFHISWWGYDQSFSYWGIFCLTKSPEALSIPYCWVCCMCHKSPRANNCPSPAPAGVHIFHTCGWDNEHCECGGKQQGLQHMFLQYLCSLPVSSLSLLPFNAKVKFPDLQRAFSLNRNWHRPSISVCSWLYVCLYTAQMQVLWRPCGLDDTTVIKQMATVTNWKIPYRNSAPKLKWNFCHYMLTLMTF